MRVADALKLFREGERLAWRSLCAGTLPRCGLRSTVGAFTRPITAPSRYPEYQQLFELLRTGLDLDDPSAWLLDISSPKMFSLLLTARTRATVVATDIWPPAVREAIGLRGGLPAAAAARLHLGVMDVREPVPPELQPPKGLFDAAFSMSVIEHIEPDPGGDRIALRRIAEIVRSGGAVVISVPVAATARSDYLASVMYGRKPSDERGAFFQRVYDAPALRELCVQMAPSLSLAACVIVTWPDHVLLRLQPRFPNVLGLVGALFPLIADGFTATPPSPTIPEIHADGDALLSFRRV